MPGTARQLGLHEALDFLLDLDVRQCVNPGRPVDL
jgi:hypothetical protein